MSATGEIVLDTVLLAEETSDETSEETVETPLATLFVAVERPDFMVSTPVVIASPICEKIDGLFFNVLGFVPTFVADLVPIFELLALDSDADARDLERGEYFVCKVRIVFVFVLSVIC